MCYAVPLLCPYKTYPKPYLVSKNMPAVTEPKITGKVLPFMDYTGRLSPKGQHERGAFKRVGNARVRVI